MDASGVRLLILIGVTLFIVFARCAEYALKEANEAKLAKLFEKGDKRAERVIYLQDNYSSIYSMTYIFITAGQIFLAAYIAYEWCNLKIGYPIWTLFATEGVYALVLFVFGMYIPKKIALASAEKIAMGFSGFVLTTFKIVSPLIKLLAWISKGIMRLFGIKYSDAENDITEDEIKLMVEMGSQSGAIDPEEKEMIHNIFEMGETPVSEIMTHRTDIEILWSEDTHEVWENTISKSKHSIYPVCGETADDVIGIVGSKDFYRKLLKNKDFNVKSIIKPAVFVPETVKADELLKTMQQSKNHFVIVLDEYGGTAGIVTMSDMLEEIVGNFEEYEEPEIVKKGDNLWIINGTADLDEVSKSLGLELPTEEYNTLAGMILAQMDTIPTDGTTPEIEAFGLKIKITKILERRIEKTRVSIIKKEEN